MPQSKARRPAGGAPAAPTDRRPALVFASRSRPSERHSERNEDRVLVDRTRRLAAVFDGVGGSVAGAVAAEIAVRIIRRGWRGVLRQYQPAQASALLQLDERVDVCAALCTMLEEAHAQIRAEGLRQANIVAVPFDETHPATTVALAAFCRKPGARGYIMAYAWVGDSRIYLLRATKPLRRLTRDDGLLTRLVRERVLTAAAAAQIDQATRSETLSHKELLYFHQRNSITQALGGALPPSIHVGRVTVTPGDRVLLCTDGIHDNLTEQELEAILRHRARTTVAGALVQGALERSRQASGMSLRAKPDDMTAVVVTCER
ncbi:MAG TPA: PP2C family serine/threonine-protein phosphatase [Ktedonobacterales bacterium]